MSAGGVVDATDRLAKRLTYFVAQDIPDLLEFD